MYVYIYINMLIITQRHHHCRCIRERVRPPSTFTHLHTRTCGAGCVRVCVSSARDTAARMSHFSNERTHTAPYQPPISENHVYI